MNTNHHLSKPAMIGKINSAGTFDVVWRSINPIKPSVWSRYIPESARLTADWTLSLGLRRMRRADVQGMVMEGPALDHFVGRLPSHRRRLLQAIVERDAFIR